MDSEPDGTHTSEPNLSKRRKRLYRCLHRIYKTTMILSVLIIVILFFQNSESFHEKQVTQTASLPRKFFPSHGHVTEYHLGNLQPVIKLIEQEELIFVMYYAPWCSESMYVRGEFLRAAKVMSSIVKFVAVNCWYPDGECRQHMKFLYYPQLYVYHIFVHDGYKYSGIKEAEYFVKFVESFLFPLKSLQSARQILEFTAESDNTVIGYFNFNSSSEQSSGAFHQFYMAAIRILSYDIFQPVKFGIVRTVDLAEIIGLTDCNSFILTRQGNSTLKYPPYFNMTASNITNWVIWNKQKNLSPWLVPPGVKSLTLSLPMQKGPAVLVFAPANPLVDFYPYHNMVRLAAYAIRSCSNNTAYYSNLLNTYVHTTFTRLNSAKKLHKKCVEKSVSSNDNKCCISLLASSEKIAQSSVCDYCVFKSAGYAGKVCDISFNSDVRSERSSKLMNSCSDFYQFYNVNEHHSVCCKNTLGKPLNFYQDDVLDKRRKATDSFVINGKDMFTRLHMAKLTLQKIKHLTDLEDLSKVVTKFSDIRDGYGITGLQCRLNKTIDFYYIDSVYHSVLMERFHVPVASQPSKVSVLLVDLADEAVYVLQEKLNYQSLARFVLNYTKGVLTRHRQSTEVVTPKECGSTSAIVCVVDVTMETFQSVVMDNNKDVLLYYYAQWCGYCSQFSHIYLTVAQYFKDNDKIIFARKSDSILFPENVAKTVPNLIKFILYHSNQSLQIDTAVGVCTNECVRKNRDRVLIKITELERSVAQIQRRAFTIRSQTLINDNHRQYIQSASAALWRSQNIHLLKLRKAQILNHFLQKNWKQFDKSTMLELIQKSKAF